MKGDYAPLLEKSASENPGALRLAKVAHSLLSSRCYQLTGIAPGKSRTFLEAYLERFLVEDIKRILRAKHAGQSADKSILIPIPKGYDSVGLPAVIQAASIQEAVGLLAATQFKEVGEAMPVYEKHRLVSIIEAFLDRVYFDSIIVPSLRRAPAERWIEQMVGLERDLIAIKTIMDLRARKVAADVVRSINLIPSGLTEEEVGMIVGATPEAIPRMLSKTKYSELVQPLQDSLEAGKDESLDHVARLEVFRQTKSLMFPCTFSLAYVLGYIRQAETEANNLVAIVSGKELGLTETRIQAALCV